MAEQYFSDVLIIGAGLSGLMAAQVFKERGISYQIVDKGTSTGGRLATRRIGSGLADHGAQFFTARTDEFRKRVEQWIAAGIVFEWSQGWSDGSLKRTAPDGHPRYACHGGMNALAKYLSTGLENITLDTRITKIAVQEDGWVASSESGETFEARGLLLTPPVPQALDLLRENRIALDYAQEEELEGLQYGPCLCGMFWIEGDIDLPEPGALQTPNDNITWIADNQRKGISPDTKLITVHAGVLYSQANWDLQDDKALQLLQEAVELRLQAGAQIREAQLKRWRYSVPLRTYPFDSYTLNGLPPAVFVGDAFGGRGRMEGAALSGLDGARILTDKLRRP